MVWSLFGLITCKLILATLIIPVVLSAWILVYNLLAVLRRPYLNCVPDTFGHVRYKEKEQVKPRYKTGP